MIVLLLTCVSLSSPAAARPTVREACGVYPDTEGPAWSAVVCAAVVSDINILSCSEVVGGNETQPAHSYSCMLSVDWQFLSPRAHGAATQASAEFRVHGSTLQRQDLLVAIPTIRFGPLMMGFSIDGIDPVPVVAELCVGRATPFEGELDETCTRWTAVVVAPEAGPSEELPELPVTPVANELLELATGAVGEAASGNIAWDLANTTYDLSLVCGSTTGGASNQCNQTTGHYGYGQLRFGCKSPRPGHSLGALLWDQFRAAATSVDDTGATQHSALPAPVARASACDGVYDHVNATAEAYGPLVSAQLSHA